MQILSSRNDKKIRVDYDTEKSVLGLMSQINDELIWLSEWHQIPALITSR